MTRFQHLDFDPSERRERVVEWRQAGETFVNIGKRLGIGGMRAGQLYNTGIRVQHRRGTKLVEMFNGEKQRHALERMEAAIEAGTFEVPKQLKRNPSLIF